MRAVAAERMNVGEAMHDRAAPQGGGNEADRTDTAIRPELRRMKMTTYADDIQITVSTGEYELIDEGTYAATICAIEKDEKRDFTTGEPRPALRFTFEITEPGDWLGSKIERRFITPSVSVKSTLGEWWVAINGVLPDSPSVGVKSGLMGKPCRILIEHQQTDRGGVFGRVSKVLGPARKGARPAKPAPVAVVEDEADDEFDDA